MPVFHTKTIESILEPVAQQVMHFSSAVMQLSHLNAITFRHSAWSMSSARFYHSTDEGGWGTHNKKTINTLFLNNCLSSICGMCSKCATTVFHTFLLNIYM